MRDKVCVFPPAQVLGKWKALLGGKEKRGRERGTERAEEREPDGTTQD